MTTMTLICYTRSIQTVTFQCSVLLAHAQTIQKMIFVLCVNTVNPVHTVFILYVGCSLMLILIKLT